MRVVNLLSHVAHVHILRMHCKLKLNEHTSRCTCTALNFSVSCSSASHSQGETTCLEISDPSKWDGGKKEKKKKANPHTLYCRRHFNQNFPRNFWPIKVRQGEKKKRKKKSPHTLYCLSHFNQARPCPPFKEAVWPPSCFPSFCLPPNSGPHEACHGSKRSPPNPIQFLYLNFAFFSSIQSLILSMFCLF